MNRLSAEMTGETVGEAKWAALRELERLHPGLDKGSVRFEVVSEGQRGLLGVGYEPARVIATLPEDAVQEPPATEAPAADEGEEAALIRDVVSRIAQEVGVPCTVDVEEADEEFVVTCSGRDLGMLIGRHGQTIDAIQYLANAILFRAHAGGKRVVVDAAGYRARRRTTLDAIALRAAERASATGERVELEPMTPVERRIVHERLKDDPEVETSSEGAEPNRYVVVLPRNVDV